MPSNLLQELRISFLRLSQDCFGYTSLTPFFINAASIELLLEEALTCISWLSFMSLYLFSRFPNKKKSGLE